MANIAPVIQEYLDLIDEDRDAVFFALLELDDEVIPELISKYRESQDAKVRGLLVEVIWQHRQESTIPFLAEALCDPDQQVWRQALDGLVTLASREAITAMQSAKGRRLQNQRATQAFYRVLEEAIEQASDKIKKDGLTKD